MGEQRVERRLSGRPGATPLTPTGSSVPAAAIGFRARLARALTSYWGVLIVFPSLVLALGFFLVWMAQDALRGSNLDLAEARMRDQAHMVSEHLGSALGQAESILDSLSSFAITIDESTPVQRVAPALRRLIDGRPGASYVSLSFPEGTFMGAFVDDDGALRFQVSRLQGDATSERIYDFGANETLIEHEVRKSSYDPRKRPFYQLALRSKTKVWTEPYTFARTGDTGITYTEAIWPGKTAPKGAVEHAVATIDFDVRRLSPLLSRAGKHAERPLLYNAQGAILADPLVKLHQGPAQDSAQLLNYRSLRDPVLSAFFEQMPAGEDKDFFTFSVASGAANSAVSSAATSGAHLAATAPLLGAGGLDWSVAFIAPEESFLASLASYKRRSWFLASLALLVATLASVAFARLVVRVRKEASEARDAARRARKEARELGSYRLIQLLGVGGMGEVWRAQHRLLAREAAIKLIKTNGDASVAQERFRREAQSLASLRSRNTIEIFDYGVTEEGTFFYVMELLDGLDLETLVEQDGPQPAARVVKLLIQVCRSLSEAHDAGLVHRDIKPANIFVCRVADELDVVKVLDFGLVRSLGPDVQDAEMQSPDRQGADRKNPDRQGSDRRGVEGEETKPTALESAEGLEQSTPALTHAGHIMGTPTFMAPEQIIGQNVDGRADLYALGCVAFWLLSGRLVFERDHLVAMMTAHLTEVPPSLGEFCPHPLPAAFVEIMDSCLAKSADDRPQTALDLMRVLQKIDSEMGSEWDGCVEKWWQDHRSRMDSVGAGPVLTESELALTETVVVHAEELRRHSA